MIATNAQLLAIDAGNSRLKWGLFDVSGEILASGACVNSELSNLELPNATRVIISNVAGTEIATQLKLLLDNRRNIHWAHAEAIACGVINQYEEPSSLGTDRWAALIAAWQLKKSPCVVINAGTAVTIDALSSDMISNQGVFVGGLILPGLDLMLSSLDTGTAQLPKFKQDNSSTKPIEIFANNTSDAMQAGVLNAVLGAIVRMKMSLQIESQQIPFILISGGNGPTIARHLQNDSTLSVFAIENLVLQGLYQLDLFRQSKQA